MKTTLSYDHYFNYAEMKEVLENFTQTYPELCHVEANCITPEGREQFAVTLTNTKTGEALSKPGWYPWYGWMYFLRCRWGQCLRCPSRQHRRSASGSKKEGSLQRRREVYCLFSILYQYICAGGAPGSVLSSGNHR